MSHALDQVAAEKDKLWDVAEQLAAAIVTLQSNHVHDECVDKVDCVFIGDPDRIECDPLFFHAALAEWKKL